MAKVKKPGRQKEYTAAGLERACEAYFNSISYQEPAMKKVPDTDEDGVARLDDKGHILYRYEQITTADGKPAFETCWIEPPGIVALCLYLGIHRSTFDRYGSLAGSDAESERFRNTVTRARGRVEAYLAAQLENRSAARGAIFNLQQNFGWKDRKEISLDEGTRRAMAAKSMSLEEKEALLREIGAEMPE